MELFYREGPRVIEQLKENDHPIFLDLKLHDIPTTVMPAMKNIARLEVEYVNVQALGGGGRSQRAREGLLSGSHQQRTKLRAVSLLTAIDNAAMNEDVLLPGAIDANVRN